MPTQYQIVVTAADKTGTGFSAVERSANDTLKRIKSTWGQESTLGNIGKIATGAGAVAGVTLVGRAIEGATGAVVKLNDEWKKTGRISQETTDEVIRQIPLFGNIYGTVANIAEAITGELATRRAITAEIERQVQVQETLNRIAVAADESREQNRRRAQELQMEGALIGKKSPDSDWIRMQQGLVKAQQAEREAALRAAAKVSSQATYQIDGKSVPVEQAIDVLRARAGNAGADVTAAQAEIARRKGRGLGYEQPRRDEANAQARLDAIKKEIADADEIFTKSVAAQDAIFKGRDKNLNEIASNFAQSSGVFWVDVGSQIIKKVQEKIAEGAKQSLRIDEHLDRLYFDVIDSVDRAERERLDRPEKDRIDESLNKFFDFESDIPEFMKQDRTKRFSDAVESRGTGVGALARSQSLDPAIQVAKDSNKTLKDTKVLTEQMAAGIVALVRVAAGGVQAYNGVGAV